MNGIFKYLLQKTAPLIILLFVSTTVISQTPTPDQLNQLPANVDPSQLNKANMGTYFKDNNKVGANTDRGKDNNERLKTPKNKLINEADSSEKFQPKTKLEIETERASQTYGANVFKNASIFDIAELSTPPLDYPIGVGDHIVVALWGGGEYQEDYIVARDGAIFPNNLGKITVQGLTFEVARSLIYARFRSVVPASTNIQITLGQPRTINVNVGGEVEKPGPVTISAFSNAYNAIGLAGGTTEFGNLRDIQIKRNGKIIESIDIYKYLSSGDIGSRVYLQNNDFVLVNNDVIKVSATGLFKRPMYYQLKKDEGIKALMRYSGGFKPQALSSAVKIIRSENETQLIRTVNATSILKAKEPDYILNDGDIVKADSISIDVQNKLAIKGFVKYPGIYEFKKNDRVFDAIARAGGLDKNAYLERAYIFRGGADSTNYKSDRQEISLVDYQFNNKASLNNILLYPNDMIQVFLKNDFKEELFVEISGQVRKEGRVKLYGNMTLQDLIFLSGGIKQDAEYGRLEVSSILDIDAAKRGLMPTQNVIKYYNIQSNLELDSLSAQILLKPYDQVFVRKNPTFTLQENVKLTGLVKYAGLYPRLSKHERLSSFISRAGGFLENANIGGAILYRKNTDLFRDKIVNQEKIDSNITMLNDSIVAKRKAIKDSVELAINQPVSIDLFKALKYKNSKYDIVLQENDVLFVPEINPFVVVQGKVQSPIKVNFDPQHTKLSYYIDQAGGYSIRPWRKRIFVTDADGRSRQTKNFVFFKVYPKIKEGSIITVPARPESKELNGILVTAATSSITLLLTYFVFRIK